MALINPGADTYDETNSFPNQLNSECEKDLSLSQIFPVKGWKMIVLLDIRDVLILFWT